MTKQVVRYECPECGAGFDTAERFEHHMMKHETTAMQELAKQENYTPEQVHANKELSEARIPIFGAMLAFLGVFILAGAERLGLFAPVFAPLFIAATAVAVISMLFLTKFVLEG